MSEKDSKALEKQGEGSTFVDKATTLTTAVSLGEALQKAGKAGQELGGQLIELLGDLSPESEAWIKALIAPAAGVTAMAVGALPLTALAGALFAIPLFISARNKKVRDATEKRKQQEELAAIRLAIEALANSPNDAHHHQRLNEQIHTLYELKASKAEVNAMFVEFHKVLQGNADDLKRIEKKLEAGVDSAKQFFSTIQSTLEEISERLSKVESNTELILVNQVDGAALDQQRHAEVITLLQEALAPKVDLLAQRDELQERTDEQKKEIARLLAEIKEIRARGHVHENVLQQAVILFAENKLQEALDAYESVEAKVDAVAIQVHRGKGDVLMAQHRYVEAEREYKLCHHLDPRSPAISSLLFHSLFECGKYNEALEMARITRELVFRSNGPSSDEATAARGNIGVALLALGNYDDALEEFVASRNSLAQLEGEFGLRTLQSEINIATAEVLMGNLDGAIDRMSRVIPEIKQRHGQAHIAYIRASVNLASALRKGKQAERALKMQISLLRYCERSLGKENPLTLNVLNNLGTTNTELGRHKRALELHLDSYQRRKKVYGENHPFTLTSINNVAIVYADLGDLDHAEKQMLIAFDGRRKMLGDAHPMTVQSRDNLREIRRRLGKPESGD